MTYHSCQPWLLFHLPSLPNQTGKKKIQVSLAISVPSKSVCYYGVSQRQLLLSPQTLVANRLLAFCPGWANVGHWVEDKMCVCLLLFYVQQKVVAEVALNCCNLSVLVFGHFLWFVWFVFLSIQLASHCHCLFFYLLDELTAKDPIQQYRRISCLQKESSDEILATFYTNRIKNKEKGYRRLALLTAGIY